MNVNAEADVAYIAEKGLRIGPVVLKSWPAGICTRCGGTIYNAPFLSSASPVNFARGNAETPESSGSAIQANASIAICHYPPMLERGKSIAIQLAAVMPSPRMKNEPHKQV